MNNVSRFALILAALAFVVSCGGSSSTPTSPSPGTNGTAVSIVSGAGLLTTTAYSPNPLTITAGSTVTWTNRDTVTHTTTSDTGLFDGNLVPNAQFSFTFQNKGTFAYHCTLHPGMVATVVVQ